MSKRRSANNDHIIGRSVVRQPGESLRFERFYWTKGNKLYLIGALSGVWFLSLFTFIHLVFDTQFGFSDHLFNVAGCTLAIVVLWFIPRPEAHAPLMGEQGERIVADELAAKLPVSYHTIHDFRSTRRTDANIDHIAIGPAGIFVIETKARSRPDNTNSNIVHYDGTTLRVGNHNETAALAQARACRDEIRNIAADALELDPVSPAARQLVRAVVTFPGFTCEKRSWGTKMSEPDAVWVLAPAAVCSWIKNERAFRLNKDQIKRVVDRLRASVA